MIKRIELILQSQNLTPSQFADRIGVQRSGLSHILSGRNNPSLDFVQKVLQAFPDLNPLWLLQGKGRMYVNMTEGTGGKEPFSDKAEGSDKAALSRERELPFEVEEAGKTEESKEMEKVLGNSPGASSGPIGPESRNTDWNAGMPGMEKAGNQTVNTVVQAGNGNLDEEERGGLWTIPDSKERPETKEPEDSEPPVSGKNPVKDGERPGIEKIVFFYTDGTFEVFRPRLSR